MAGARSAGGPPRPRRNGAAATGGGWVACRSRDWAPLSCRSRDWARLTCRSRHWACPGRTVTRPACGACATRHGPRWRARLSRYAGRGRRGSLPAHRSPSPVAGSTVALCRSGPAGLAPSAPVAVPGGGLDCRVMQVGAGGARSQPTGRRPRWRARLSRYAGRGRRGSLPVPRSPSPPPRCPSFVARTRGSWPSTPKSPARPAI